MTDMNLSKLQLHSIINYIPDPALVHQDDRTDNTTCEELALHLQRTYDPIHLKYQHICDVRLTTLHRVCFSAACLAICKNRGIETLQELFHFRSATVLKNICL